MSESDRPQPELFHRLRKPPPRIPKGVKIAGLVILGLIVLMFAGCAWLFGGLIAGALERAEPTRVLITSVSASGGLSEDDARLAEGPVLTPARLARLNAEIATLGAPVFVGKPVCTAHSYRGPDQREGDFVSCLAEIDYLDNQQRRAEIVWLRQRGAWYIDDFTLQDLRAE